MKRNGFRVAMQLIGRVLPFMHLMLLAIVLGVLGFLCAIIIPVMGAYGLVQIVEGVSFSWTWFVGLLVFFAIARGILRYAEQACNHFIAFKILAEFRNQIFAKLRTLAPAKLDGRDKGNLISIITSDIELLEVFFAHTISPIGIAFLTSMILLYVFYQIHVIIALVALVGYLIVGIVIPVVMSKKGREDGITYRNEFGELNGYLLDNIRGVKEILQFDAQAQRLANLHEKNDSLEVMQARLKAIEGEIRAISDIVILSCIVLMCLVASYFYMTNEISLMGFVVAVVAMASSFGPVVALSNLANNLFYTFASGNRVLDLLEESPEIEEVEAGVVTTFEDVSINNVHFAYEDETILDDVSLSLPPRAILGIQGKSGSGKSTLLKLLMRFYDTNAGSVSINGNDVRTINTKNLRTMQSYVTQDTYLFDTTIYENIAIAKADATKEEVMQAANKAAMHERILSFPKGYDTKVGELGDSLSGGERQRIGLARAFLYDSPCLLLDEPTSNLDSLNEAEILKVLDAERENRTVVLVSHRASTLRIADSILQLETGRNS